MNAIDTNVWVYAYDTREPAKRGKARELLETATPLVLPWQVGCEFVAASRKLAVLGFTQDDAWDALEQIMELCDAIILPTPKVWDDCRELQQVAGLHYWDALLIAACRAGGVTRLYSEDLPAGLDLPGFEIANPFLA